MSGVIECARFIFRGRLVRESFIEFALHRARRLDLAINVDTCDGASATLLVKGQEDLVDAFEMACSLGPYDCLILDIERGGANRSGT
ncbi:hypothetical protein [Rhizobium sp. Rhizsp42]|jgi:hypothetical protein|uniref:hypothetical protein n=1 Tax=Rhizobium sp. Rhizsp42 TaxID=3243034 RepID=UPI000DD9EFC6